MNKMGVWSAQLLASIGFALFGVVIVTLIAFIVLALLVAAALWSVACVFYMTWKILIGEMPLSYISAALSELAEEKPAVQGR